MNIFVLDKDIQLAAQYHVDRHIVKMPLETAQLLCTAHHLSSTNAEAPYRATHRNHPCAIWARRSLDNYLWLCDFGFELCKEYTFRYKKTHKCEQVINWCKNHRPDIPNEGLTPFAQAMPDEYKSSEAVASYRAYYRGEKQHLFNWKNREKPCWI